MILLKNRSEAGQKLAKLLESYKSRADVLVLALPRGGVPVAYEIAKSLGAPLDLALVRKLGAPGQEELAIGAIGAYGECVLDERLIAELSVSRDELKRIIQCEYQELQRRDKLYRGSRPPIEVEDKTVILVDDGLATGASMQAAIAALRSQRPKSIVVAVPVAPASSCEKMRQTADVVVCYATPEPFFAVGLWYEDFRQTTDAEVCCLLENAPAPNHAARQPDSRSTRQRQINTERPAP